MSSEYRNGRSYVLLDRDGTVIRERNYLASPDHVELLPGVIEGLRLFRRAGYGLILVTNQSGIGRGYLTEKILGQIHRELERQLAAEGVYLDAILYCPHTPEDNCVCRKPEPGLVQQAVLRFGFDAADAIMIGDKPADLELGRRCGMRTVLVRSGYGRQTEAAGPVADFICDDLLTAARALLSSMSDLELIREHVARSIAAKQAMLERCADLIASAATEIGSCMRNGGKLLLCGNGGSAADCQHIAAEFVGMLNHHFPRPGLPAIALTTDTSILTASANDAGFESVFARQVQALGRRGDVLLALSTSGNSPNVCRALQCARESEVLTIALTGDSGGAMASVAGICIRVPDSVTQYVQECHIVIGHLICALVERQLFPGLQPAISER